MALLQPNTTESFTASSQALNQIVEQFRNQTLPLEEALTLFETGIAHVRNCQQTLGAAKGKLQTLNQALAEIQTPQPTITPVETIQPTTLTKQHFTWQAKHTIPAPAETTHPLLDEAWLKQLLLKLKADLPFQTQGLPKLYERENRSGLEAFLPLANGWLLVSVWRPTTTQEGYIQLQLQIATLEEALPSAFSTNALEQCLAAAYPI
jgi:exodeoxyribonuclease VII small subunit